MSKKLNDNGLWESSRMMLPEHVESIRKANHELDRKEQPVLDEQEMEAINDAIYRSLEERIPIRLRLFDPFEKHVLEGVVDRVDSIRWRIRVDGCWFDLRRVIGLG